MRLCLGCLLLPVLAGQQPQNPSPMVEHSRAHRRLTEQHPPGRRERLELGTLFVPVSVSVSRRTPILFFFHGGTWVPEVAAARDHLAVVSIQAGAGSASYARLFQDPHRFAAILSETESKLGVHFRHVWLGGWSAGCGAIRTILQTPESYRRVDGVLLIDGMHADYLDGTPGPLESKIDPDPLRIWLQLGRDAMAHRKRAVVTHSEIFPGTFASTTETADYLVTQLHLTEHPVLKWGPMGLQQLSEARTGRFLLIGYAGNSAPDHVDQLHALPEFLKWIR